MQGYVSKGEQFHHPEPGGTYLGRFLASARSGDALWVAAQMERDGRNGILVRCKTERGVRDFVLDSTGLRHQPALAALPDGGVAVVWNEARDAGWRVRSAVLRPSAPGPEDEQTVPSAAGVCLPPAVAHGPEGLWACWSMLSGGAFRVHAALRCGRQWRELGPVSAEGVDAFRPCVAAAGDRVYLMWDQYRDRRYEVAAARWDGGRWTPILVQGRQDERWLRPRLAGSPDGTAYATWVVLQEVEDDLGIRDHFPFAMAARIRDDVVRILTDEGNAADVRIAADLREGLLAEEFYKGYHGLRRRPQLAFSEADGLWLLWEVRLEAKRESLQGHLAGRRLKADGAWGEAVFLHDGFYGYAVGPDIVDGELTLGLLNFAGEGTGIVCADAVRLDGGRPHRVDGARWRRWRPARPAPAPKPPGPVLAQGKHYGLFWADTHCHSNFSGDAEGEPDELIHFARDVAGLDAVCVVDNDYYPHKALTEVEWRIHQSYSDRFTTPGEFVVFSGYEFTYHQRGLDPDFNHRSVIHPAPGGPLLRRIDPAAQSPAGLMAALEGSTVMCAPHHCSYELTGAGPEWNVEVCSSWRVCLEETAFTIRQLKAGQRFGFIGASDTHRAVPGLGGALTGLFAEALTPEALFDAYRHRRTIATQGFFILIDFRVGGAFIGGEVEAQGPPLVEAAVRAPRPIESVTVVRSGAPIRVESPGAEECAFSFEDGEVPAGDHFYFLRVKLVGDPSLNLPGDPATNPLIAFSLDSRYPHNLARARGTFAWTSPIWVRVR